MDAETRKPEWDARGPVILDKSQPVTFFVVRENMAWMDDYWHNFIRTLVAEDKKTIVKKNSARHFAEFSDGTKVLGISAEADRRGMSRGYSNRRFV